MVTVSGYRLAAGNSATAAAVACMICGRPGCQAITGTNPGSHESGVEKTDTVARRSLELSAADSAVPTQLRAIELNLQYRVESAKVARAEQAD